ncbi:MAG: hypothetical protein EXR43_00765 [Dehalococcoidia bacterium]|nr:hypothetical protein [Dehalococcoidia bacterium]
MLPLFFISVLALAVLSSGGAQGAGAGDALRFPFNPLNGWYVQQGYDQGTHGGYERYALDLARHDGAAGHTIVAPVSGRIAWFDDAYGCVSIALARDALFLSICHLELQPSLDSGDPISAGATIGTVAAPGRRLNGGMDHIHLALYTDPSSGADRTRRTAVPFTDTNALSGLAFPAGKDYTGVDLLSLLPVVTAPGAPSPAPAPAAAVYPAQPIRAGANTIVYFGPPASPRDAFAGLAGYRAVYEWDAVAGRWRYDIAGVEAGDLRLLQPFRAYWLISDGAGTLLPGTPPQAPLRTLTLSSGSNLIAYAGGALSAAALQELLDDALTAVYGWDGDTGWRYYLVALPAASTLTKLEAWGVYWIFSARHITVTLP